MSRRLNTTLDIITPNVRGPEDIDLGEQRIAFFEKALRKHSTEDLVLLLRTVQSDAANSEELYQRGAADMLLYLLGMTHKPPVLEETE
ncbi:hypothetical protein [Enterovibrio baiacu]|uniref:hypothetical protein n=1 Tax=Enterovibrio baiacu TaxID=2491023 RepID=UPI003D0CB57A